MTGTLQHSPRNRSQAGMTLIETVVALGILLILAAGIMTVAMTATSTTEDQGNLAARTAEYAQDKMEQLISLTYADTTTDTTVFPACTPPTCTTGTGLTVGGSSDPTAPVTTPGNGFVDYLDATGTPLVIGAGGAAPAGWYYIRVWQISNPGGNANLKQIDVTCRVNFNVSQHAKRVTSTFSTVKANPF